jgi:hypothetical protein
MNPFVSITDPDGRDFLYSHAEDSLLVPFALVTMCAPAKKQGDTYPAFTHPITFLKIMNQGAFPGRP